MNSLCCRCNLTSVSNACEADSKALLIIYILTGTIVILQIIIMLAAPISLFWASNRLDKYPEVHFAFPFILIGKSIIAFLTG